MFYRFNCGVFFEGETFEEAKQNFLNKINKEKENPTQWHKCTCVGFGHRHGCPQENRNPVTGEVEISF